MAAGRSVDPAGVSGCLWILTDRRYLEQRMPIALFHWLCERGRAPSVVLADGAAPAIWSWLEPGDLVIARSRDPLAPALLEDAEARGAHTLDAGRAVERVRDKAACVRALAREGLPFPRTLVAEQSDDLRRLPKSAYPLVVKPVLGDNARGVRVVSARDQLDLVDWEHGPYLAQEYVDAGGVDTKLYIVGDRVWATRRASPLLGIDGGATRVPVTPALQRIADGCRRAFGLSLFGVDVLESAGRLAIVDVNEFPNYTGIDEAPEAIGSLLISRRSAPAAGAVATG